MPRKRPEINVQLTKRQTDRCRSAIQTTKIIQHLQKVFFGQAEANPSQIRAAGILLNKALPDLQSMEVADVTEKDYGTPEQAIANFEALARDRMLDQLTRVMGRDKAEAILDGKALQESD